MDSRANVVETVWSPAGFVEQKYIGNQDSASIKKGHDKLRDYSKKLSKQNKPLLILVDVTELGKTDTATHMVAIKGIKTIDFKRAAMYGPVATQVLVNTLALVAGKKDIIKAFANRTEALKWLLGREGD